MTSQVGTFIPLQTHTAGWNPNIGHQHNSSIFLVPTSGYGFGSNFSGIAQGITSQGSQLAFIPNHGHIAGTAFAPSNTGLQGVATGAVVGIAGFQGHGTSAVTQSFATELSENHNEYVISFDVPGIEIQDLDISLSGNTIFINGIRKGSHDASTLAYSEIAHGPISRTISVPFDVSSNKAINTSLENGVLKIRIAKDSQSDKRVATRKVKIG